MPLRTRRTNDEAKPPSLLDISPFQINPPHTNNKHRNSESRVVKNHNFNEKTKNNNIPSLLSLELAPQEKPEPVSLLSLNFDQPRRPPLASLVPPRLVNNSGLLAGNRNSAVGTGTRNGQIPSLFECDVMSGSDTSPPSAHPLLITPPVRPILVPLPGTFPNNFSPPQQQAFTRTSSLDGSLPPAPNPSAIPQQPNAIPSLLSAELSWMGCEPQDRISLVPRSGLGNGGPTRGRRKYCFNCYGYDHTASGCSNPKNYFKRQWLQDGMK